MMDVNCRHQEQTDGAEKTGADACRPGTPGVGAELQTALGGQTGRA